MESAWARGGQAGCVLIFRQIYMRRPVIEGAPLTEQLKKLFFTETQCRQHDV